MIIDLTMPIEEKTPNFPGDPILKVKRHNVKEHSYGKTFLEIQTNIATHIDAPSHMIEDGKTLSDFPTNKFIGDAIVIDVRGQKFDDGIPLAKSKGRLPAILNKEEVKSILRATFNLNHRLVLMFLYYAGIRSHELINLKSEDIDFQRDVIHV